MKPKRLSCQQYMARRAAENRDRQVEQLFSDLEREALRERLAMLTPDREKSTPRFTSGTVPHARGVPPVLS